MRPTPRAMKNVIDFWRPATTILPAYAESPVPAACGRDLRRFALSQSRVRLRNLDRLRDTEELQDLDLNPRRIELVPCQTVPRRSRMRVMVIVPAFAERNQRYPPVVARIVVGGKPPRAPHVRRRVDQPGGVQPEHDAQGRCPTAPSKSRRSAYRITASTRSAASDSYSARRRSDPSPGRAHTSPSAVCCCAWPRPPASSTICDHQAPSRGECGSPGWSEF